MRDAWNALRAGFDRRIAPTTAWTAARRFLDHEMTDRAATLSYYAMLSLFPGLLVAVTLIGLVGGDEMVRSIGSFAAERGAAPGTQDVITTVSRSATEISGGTVSLALVVSLVLALNAASGIFNAAGRAVNAAHEVDDERGFARRRATVYAITGFVLLLLLVALALVVVGGDLTREVFDLVGLGTAAADVWNLVRWPLALVLALVAVAVVLRYAPSEAARRRTLLTRGSLVTVAGWIAASAGFSVHVANSDRYGTIYGTFATAIVLLLWLYLLAIAFLYGAEVDAETKQRRAAARGVS